MKKDIWAKLEKLNREKFPKCVQFLLVKSAYNSLSTLRQINSDKLANIESFLNNNKQYIAQLDCCYHEHYKGLNTFEFLPGHKDLILGIPSQIERLNGGKQMSRKTASISDDELQDNLVSNILNYTEKIGLIMGDNVISQINIIDFRRGTDKDGFTAKCRFICPLCAKTFTVTRKTYWATSNVTKHFKEHVTMLSNEQCEQS